MIVVSNASPLINLAWIDELDIIPKLFGEITVPKGVWDEVVSAGKGKHEYNNRNLLIDCLLTSTHCNQR